MYSYKRIGGYRLITLSNASDKPIYEQICDQFKELILRGQLLPGSPLPSIRSLAKELKVSVMTTKRAYTDLERDGFIETVPGKGSFVAMHNQHFLREAFLTDIEKHISLAIHLAQTVNMEKDKFLQHVALLLEEEWIR